MISAITKKATGGNRSGAAKIAGVAVMLLLSALAQNTGFFPAVYSSRPLLMIPAVVCTAMTFYEGAGFAAGIFSGLMWDTVSPAPDGIFTLFLGVCGAVCGLLSRYRFRSTFLTSYLFSCAASLVGCVLYCVFRSAPLGSAEFSTAFFAFYLPSFVYTAVVSVFYAAFLHREKIYLP